MKKLLIFLMCMIIPISFSSCGKEQTDVSTTGASSNLSSLVPEGESTVSEPQLNSELTKKLNSFMKDSFGGAGNPEHATSWYSYINSYEVYEDSGKYKAKLSLNTTVDGKNLRLILGQNLTEESTENLTEILLNVGSALNLDETSLCVVGDSLYNIMNSESGVDIYYSSISAYGIPVYAYIAETVEVSESEVRSYADNLGGEAFANCIYNNMATQYAGNYTGLSIYTVDTMALSVISNFDEVYLDSIEVYDSSNSLVETYENQTEA